MGLNQSIEELEKCVEQLKQRVQNFNGKLASSEFCKLQKDLNEALLKVITFRKRRKSKLNSRCNRLLIELSEALKLLSEKVSLEDCQQNEETLPQRIKKDNNILINEIDDKINQLGSDVDAFLLTRNTNQRVLVEALIKVFVADLSIIIVKPESELDLKKKCLLQKLAQYQERLLALDTRSMTSSEHSSVGNSSMNNQPKNKPDINVSVFPEKPSSSTSDLSISRDATSTCSSSNYQNPRLELNQQLLRKCRSVEVISPGGLEENDKVHLTGSTENVQYNKQKIVNPPIPFQPLRPRHKGKYQKHINPPIVAPPNFSRSTSEGMLNNNADNKNNVRISVPVLVVKNKLPNYNDVSKEVQLTNQSKRENIKPPVVYQTRNINREIPKQDNNKSITKIDTTRPPVTIDQRAIVNKQTDKIQINESLESNNPENKNVKKSGFPSSWFKKKKQEQTQNTGRSKNKEEDVTVNPPIRMEQWNANDNCSNTKILVSNDDKTKSEETGSKNEENKIFISESDSIQEDYNEAINFTVKNKQFSLLASSKTYAI